MLDLRLEGGEINFAGAFSCLVQRTVVVPPLCRVKAWEADSNVVLARGVDCLAEDGRDAAIAGGSGGGGLLGGRLAALGLPVAGAASNRNRGHGSGGHFNLLGGGGGRSGGRAASVRSGLAADHPGSV